MDGQTDMISPKGIAFIKEWEGVILQAYDDVDDRVVKPGERVFGTLSIGVGHTNAAGPPKVYVGMMITEEESDAILASDLRSVELQIDHLVKVPLNQNQRDCLISFEFNTGWLGHPHCSLLSALNSGNYNLADEDFMLYDRSQGKILKGLQRRRLAEKKLFMEPIA